MSIGKSREGRQSPYHDDLSAPPRAKKSINGSSRVMLRVRHADEYNGPGEVAGVERLLVGGRDADRIDHHVGTEPAGELLYRRDDAVVIEVLGVDRVGGTEGRERARACLSSKSMRDDRVRADQPGAGDRGRPDAATADDRDALPALDRAGVDRGAEARHDTAAEQAGSGSGAVAGSTFVH